MLAPVFLIIAFGYFFYAADDWETLISGEANRVVYWIGLPAFLLISPATAPPSSAPAGRLILVLLAALTAAASYTMATQLGGNVELSAGSAVLNTLLAVFALVPAVAYY